MESAIVTHCAATGYNNSTLFPTPSHCLFRRALLASSVSKTTRSGYKLRSYLGPTVLKQWLHTAYECSRQGGTCARNLVSSEF